MSQQLKKLTRKILAWGNNKATTYTPTHILNDHGQNILDAIEALLCIEEFLNSLPKGWLGKTSGDVGALNDFYISYGKAKKDKSDDK